MRTIPIPIPGLFGLYIPGIPTSFKFSRPVSDKPHQSNRKTTALLMYDNKSELVFSLLGKQVFFIGQSPISRSVIILARNTLEQSSHIVSHQDGKWQIYLMYIISILLSIDPPLSNKFNQYLMSSKHRCVHMC